MKQKIFKFNSKKSVNKDILTNVFIVSNNKNLPFDDIHKIIDLGDRFNEERKSSNLYRFIFTINTVFSNPLFNVNTNGYTGSISNPSPSYVNNSWKTFNEDIFKIDPYDNDYTGVDYTYEESIDKHLKEVDGWFGFYDPNVKKNGECDFFDLEPTRERFSLNTFKYNNWDVLLTYPSSSDKTHHIVNGGLLISDVKSVKVGGKDMIAFGTPIKHGLSIGDKILLSSMPVNDWEGEFIVQRRGLDNGDNKDNYFVVDINPNNYSSIINGGFNGGRMKRVINDRESEYYFRIFSKIDMSNNSYEIFPLAFSKNIYSDDIYQLLVHEEIDISNLRDNLNRPLSELYLTFIKTNDNGFFTNIKSGVDVAFIDGTLSDVNISNIRRIHDGITTPFTSHIPLENNVTNNLNSFYGDIVEYNVYNQIEMTLGEVMYRFNTTNRETSTSTSTPGGPRREGYIYKPHNKIKIRSFSSYIEEGDETTSGIPDYAVDMGDGRYLWRDLLDIGVSDGDSDSLVDYPFLNGVHYIHKNICFLLHRQDPFGKYGLYYSGGIDPYDPADIIGVDITDKYKVNKSEDVC